MPQSISPDRTTSSFLTAVTAAVAVALRLARIPNIFAVGSLGLYAGARLPLWLAWIPSMAVMAVTDEILWRTQGWARFNPWVYGSFLGYVLLGLLLRGSRSFWRIAGVTFLGSLQFFLITNYGVWANSLGLAEPLYPHTIGGLIACYTAGLPFFGYTLIGDLGFTAAVFAAEAALPQTAPEPAAEEVRA
jgi:hypothetical protein